MIGFRTPDEWIVTSRQNAESGTNGDQGTTEPGCGDMTRLKNWTFGLQVLLTEVVQPVIRAF
jgi:hypothetical protein